MCTLHYSCAQVAQGGQTTRLNKHALLPAEEEVKKGPLCPLFLATPLPPAPGQQGGSWADKHPAKGSRQDAGGWLLPQQIWNLEWKPEEAAQAQSRRQITGHSLGEGR